MWPLPVRPRGAAERLRMAELLLRAPQVVAPPPEDDGWIAACLRLGGRDLCLHPGPAGDRTRRLLRGLGLGGGEDGGAPGAQIDVELRLHGEGGAARLELPALPPATEPTLPVTVLICTFNREALLPLALRSACAQGWPGEIIVVNDGSSDGTAAWLDAQRAAWPEGAPPLRVLHQPNRGKAAALNRGVALAAHPALLVLDDDDVLLPGALRALATALAAAPAASSATGDLIAFSDDGAGPTPRLWRPALRGDPRRSVDLALQEMPSFPGATLCRTEALRAAGPFDEALVHIEDLDMAIRLAEQGPTACLPLPTLLYRLHPGARGPAHDRFEMNDADAHHRRMQPKVAALIGRHAARLAGPGGPAEHTEGPDRDLRVSLAMGCLRKGAREEAARLIDALKPPFTARERWARAALGLDPGPEEAGTPLLVIDEGGEGALERCLEEQAGRRPLFVNLLVPREPLSDVQLLHQGIFAARAQVGAAWPPVAEVELALTSRPEWRAGRLAPAALPAGLPPAEAALAWAACQGPVPAATAPGLPEGRHPLSAALLSARAAVGGRPAEVASTLRRLVATQARWPPLWRFLAEALRAAGDHRGAAQAAAAADRLAVLAG
ncbi:MAG: glycosyltransferase family 2 protein [Deltaproteobacteria bacterium]|nr:glycosyltransferase family 2 protein [Deltaproteobacteria bacterium]